MPRTPEDGFGSKAILGSYNGKATPVKVNESGELQVSGISLGAVSIGASQKYELIQTLTFDLSEARTKESVNIAFDSFAVVSLIGSFFMYIGGNKCTINQKLSVTVSASGFYITNEAQNGNAEIWLFRIKE